MYLLLAFAYLPIEWYIPPLITCVIVLLYYCTINNITISVRRANFTLISFKVAYHANSGGERNFAGSSSYISTHIF